MSLIQIQITPNPPGNPQILTFSKFFQYLTQPNETACRGHFPLRRLFCQILQDLVPFWSPFCSKSLQTSQMCHTFTVKLAEMPYFQLCNSFRVLTLLMGILVYPKCPVQYLSLFFQIYLD